MKNMHHSVAAVSASVARNTSVMVVLVLWEVTTRTGLFNNFLLPPLSDVLWRGWLDIINGEIPRQALATAYHAPLSVSELPRWLGVVAGALMSMSAIVRRIMEPIVSVAFPIPKISFLPIFILWFGLDDLSEDHDDRLHLRGADRQRHLSRHHHRR